MRQLNAHDASFLYSDTAHANANVTLLHIYDQSTAPGGKVRFKSILAQIERRLAGAPVFRRKLLRVPLDLDNPYWVEDAHFDIEYHVRHIALPKPGDWRQFCIQVSRIHARPLDMGRPLWEVYVIEGLDSFLDLPEGSFALLTKTHHAAVDIDSGAQITTLLHDLSADAGEGAPPAPWFPQRRPGWLPIVARGLVHTAIAPLRLAAPLSRVLRGDASSVLAAAGEWLRRPKDMPVTRFNAVVSPHRVFEARRFKLEEFREIRALAPGASLNDAVLAVCGGALRRYLEGHDELPATSLTALAPFYIRADDKRASGAPAHLQLLQVQLGTHIADPAQRLRAIYAQTSASEALSRAVGARELTDAALHAPAVTLSLAGRLMGGAVAGLGRHAPLASCSVTNVPGPSTPLYLCGARLSYFSAMLPISDGLGLVLAVTHHDGQIIVSPTSCRELMPDPEHFAQCLRDSFQECLARARAQPKTPRQRTTARRAAATAADAKPAVRTAGKVGAKKIAGAAGRPAAAVKRRRRPASSPGRPSRPSPAD
jgi:diacylglycerol O-acyltransferase / wax synthase